MNVYLLIDDAAVGPLSLAEVRARLAAQEVNAATLWAVENGTEWRDLARPARPAGNQAPGAGLAGGANRPGAAHFLAPFFAGLRRLSLGSKPGGSRGQ